MFDLTIVGRNKVLFKDAANSAFFEGIDTDFEVMSFHSPLMGVLKRGHIVIDNKYKIRVASGIVGFYENKCYVIAEDV